MPDRIHLTWYTDPHNVWCWGFEPAMRRIEVAYPDAIAVDVRQGGLFEDFRPVREQWARMSGGRWRDSIVAFFDAVSSQHRMPMASAAMAEDVDDFDSTWPACIAAKAADLQGAAAGKRYLRLLREAWCLDGRGIHRRGVQEDVARVAGLDMAAFSAALDDRSAEKAFARDREECKDLAVTGFPTFVMERGDDAVRVEGWQPWEAFEDMIRKLDPGLRPVRIDATASSALELLTRYGRCATREVSAMLGTTDDDAEILLEELEAQGKAQRRSVGQGLMWEIPGALTSTVAYGPEGSPGRTT